MDYDENIELMYHLNGANELYSDMPDGAWFASMEAAAETFNNELAEECDNDFCANSAVHAWMRWSSKES